MFIPRKFGYTKGNAVRLNLRRTCHMSGRESERKEEPKLFFDIHCHAMNLSHPNLTALINRLPKLGLLGAIGIHSFSYFITLFSRNEVKRVFNLLSVMDNDVGDIFLIMEFYLKNGGLIENDALTIDNTKYDAIVLTPLLIDFGYKNLKYRGIESEIYYRIPPEKPIIPQNIDVFNGICKYYSSELVKNSKGQYEIQARRGKAVFEIYPFLGINTVRYYYKKIATMLDKYFGEYTGSYDAFKKNREQFEKFNGNIDSLGSNFFAGIKVYPPIGFNPWPDDDKEQLEKVNLLYQYCCKKHIPITTHCSDGGFVLVNKKNAKDYTSPTTWQKVLEHYPTLKINFAHFGQQGNFLFVFPNRQWQGEIVRLMKEEISPNVKKYPNVYTDFSYRAFNDDYYVSLKEVIDTDNVVLDRILFGTDFMINLIWID